MMKSDRIIVFALIWSTALFRFLFAQNYVDLVSVTGVYGAPVQFENNAAQTSISELQGSILVPLKLSEKWALLPALAGDITALRLFPKGRYQSFYQLNPRVGFRWQKSKEWSATYFWLPKRMWQKNASQRAVWQMGGLALFNYRPSDKAVKYKMGLYYNQELFGPFFVPILGLYTQKNRWEYNLTLPLSANINYRFNKRWRSGFDFFAIVRTFPVSDARFSSHYLSKATIEPKLFLRYEPVRGILLRLLAGYTIGRDYQVYERGDKLAWALSAFEFGNQRSLQNIPFDDGWVFQLNLRYRFYLSD